MSGGEIIELAFDKYDGTDEMLPPLPPIVFAHCLFDNKSSWSDVAAAVADRSVRAVYAIDLPNHGDSPTATNLTRNCFVRSVEKFVTKIGEPVVFIGHSVGTLPGIDIALRKPHLIKKLVLLDSSPIHFPSDTVHQAMLMIKIMRSSLSAIPTAAELSFSQAKEKVDSYLKTANLIDTVRKVILPTFIKDDKGYRWTTRIDEIEVLMANHNVIQMVPFKGRYNGETLIIKGENSNHVREEDYEEIKKVFPNVQIQCVRDCRHWIHVEKKQELIDILLGFLSRR